MVSGDFLQLINSASWPAEETARKGRRRRKQYSIESERAREVDCRRKNQEKEIRFKRKSKKKAYSRSSVERIGAEN